MELKFFKDEDDEIDVKIISDGNETDFNYLKMIKYLYSEDGELMVNVDAGIGDDEKDKISEVVDEIKATVSACKCIDDDEGE